MNGKAKAALTVLGLAILPGCAGNRKSPRPPVSRETAEAEVSRIGSAWTSTEVDKSLLSPPSAISVRASARTSTIELGREEGRERLVVDEEFELRSGGRVRCKTQFDHVVGLRWGRKNGEAALEITRPALLANRSCDGTAPEAVLVEVPRRALFVLTADQLVAVDPPLDGRIYRPVSE